MKNRRSLVVVMFSAFLAVFAGGCIDAVSTGFADGVTNGIATLIEELITTTGSGLAGGGV